MGGNGRWKEDCGGAVRGRGCMEGARSVEGFKAGSPEGTLVPVTSAEEAPRGHVAHALCQLPRVFAAFPTELESVLMSHVLK